MLKFTGGAKIGIANATYPFATLKVYENTLELNASLIGNLVFKTADIISIEAYRSLPLIGKGIKIKHKVKTYDQEVIFWTLTNPESILNKIKESGFLENNNNEKTDKTKEIMAKQNQGSFPLKTSVGITFVGLWNLLLIFDLVNVIRNPTNKVMLGMGTRGALSLIFISSLLALIFNSFRQLILKEGRQLEDIKKFAIFIMLISGFMLLIIQLILKIALK